MTILAAKTPAYHTILVGRDIIWCKCGTAATDGIFVYVDPDFWESLPNDNQRSFLLGHEVGHIAFAHMPRAKVFSLRGWLYRKLVKLTGGSVQKKSVDHWNPKLYNAAGDYIINADLVACGLEPIEGVLLGDYGRDDITEEVYIKLAEAEADEPEQPDQPDDDGDDGDDAGDQPGENADTNPGDSGEADDSDESDDAGDDAGDSGDESDDDAGDSGDDAGDESGGGSGADTDPDQAGHDQHLQPQYDGTEEEQEEAAAADIEDITRDIDTAIEQGELEGQHIGDEMKANSSRYSSEVQSPLTEDWRDQLSVYLNRSARSGKSTWSKLHRRRFNLLGVVTPSKIGGLDRLAVVKDISYSVSDQSLALFDAEMAELIDQLQPRSGALILHTNHQVVAVDEAFSGTEYNEIEKRGGGGTCMSAGTDWLEEAGESPDVTLVFTDGEMYPDDYRKLADAGAVMVIDSPASYVYAKHYLNEYGIEHIVINDSAALAA
tara:strand:+ start:3102 stop:4574 length:1473 start_codon:yes stop_codon:yes gene_type:complete